jgi:uncharacterized damage-inducible protein DinB
MQHPSAEKAAIAEVLDTYRGIVKWKLDDVSCEDAVRAFVPSGTSLLGIVKHLAYVERWWFHAVLGEMEVELPWTDDDPDADWRIDEGESIQDVLELYEQECAVSREVLENLESLDAEFARGDRTLIARDILLHFVEELARHVGHMDILRELIDGSTGWGPEG